MTATIDANQLVGAILRQVGGQIGDRGAPGARMAAIAEARVIDPAREFSVRPEPDFDTSK